ncbi:hypothetical protein CTI12_AA406790 [Artemisia annua]|uniref:Uncharacterized protein n=1 Tax=Artemisia annua TaxID=35608 RepID=A0A2U1M8G9_ARTAN|nr:hypothetical protein CTI12_AA406790 [Artemisia annua]
MFAKLQIPDLHLLEVRTLSPDLYSQSHFHSCILNYYLHDADLTGLTHLDLFCAKITDAGTTYLRSLTQLVCLNLSNSRVTISGLQHLKPLKKLKSLILEATKVTANDIKRLLVSDLPYLVNVRPE